MSYNFFHFNGDVRRDKKQEAMLNSLNERDNFLRRLQEMEKKREQDEKQEKAARKIQKKWKNHRAQMELRLEHRAEFDQISNGNTNRTIEDVLQMAQLLVNFYENRKDEERLVMTLVELVKAKTANREFENRIRPTQRILLARCCIKFLNSATENTIYFHIIRFLEEFVIRDLKLFESAVQLGLFEAEFHLFESLVGKPESIGKTANLNPRHLKLLNIIFEPFLNSPHVPKVSVNIANRLLKSVCLTVPDLIFTNHVFHFIRDHIKPNSPNFCVLLEALCGVNTEKWKIRAELLEMTQARIRSILVSQCDHLTKPADDSISVQNFFDSLAIFMKESRNCKRPEVKEDLTEIGRNRTAAIRYLNDFCEETLNSNNFRRAACIYVNLPTINIETIVTLRGYFNQIIDLLAGSNVLVESLHSFIAAQCQNGDFEASEARSLKTSALTIFCDCVTKRVSSVADSEFVSTHILSDFDRVVEFLRDASIKLIHVMYPNLTRKDLYSGNDTERNMKTEADWKEVTESVFSLLRAIYQKDIRINYFPEGFWTNHGRQVLSGLSEHIRMPRRRMPGGRLQIERTVDSEFVERLAGIYEVDSDSEDEEPEDDKNFLPAALRRAICVMKNIPFIVPFMDRVQLFNRLLTRERMKHEDLSNFGISERMHKLTVRRDQVYMDTFEKFAPMTTGDRVKELRSVLRVKMVNWAGMNESGIDGGGIFREFLSEVLKTAFHVNRGFFTMTESGLLYPNPTAPFLLGADCLTHFQFIGRMIGKLIYERQLQEVRFAEFFIAQLFESDKMKDVDLQHMKSFDPMIFKHLKGLQKMSSDELDELQLDFSIVTSDMGVVRTINLKPSGSNHRVTVENVQEYVRLYVNYYLKRRISSMVDALRKGISEVVSIEWMRMFAPHELQILIAGYEDTYTAQEMRKYCEFRFARPDEVDEQYTNLFWDVVENLSAEDKKSLLKFITGCSRAPIDGFKNINPPLGILVLRASSDDQLPTSATCMNMLTIPKYSTRTKLEEKLRYAINSGAGFELG